MRRYFIGGGILLGLLAAMSASPPRVQSTPITLYGDLTGDGKVGVGDALQALQIAVGTRETTPDLTRSGDVFPYPGVKGREIGDGIVDLKDAQRILQYAVGLISDKEFAPQLNGIVSFSKDVQPILVASCESFLCHGSRIPKGNLTMHEGEEYEVLVNVESSEAAGVMRVNPGDPDHSYLVAKLVDKQDALGGEGDRMPAGEALIPPPLPDDQIKTIHDWVQQGALNN